MQPVILVSFFRDACPHCRSFKPVLDALMQQGVQILRVDASHDRVSAQQWGVQGVPCTFICRPEGQGLRVLGKIEGAASPDVTVAVVRSTAADEVGQMKAAPAGANAAPAQTAAGYPPVYSSAPVYSSVPQLPIHSIQHGSHPAAAGFLPAYVALSANGFDGTTRIASRAHLPSHSIQALHQHGVAPTPSVPPHQQPQVFLSEPPRPGFNGLPSTTPRPRRP